MSAYLPSGLSVLVVLSCLLVLCQSAPMNPTEPCESTQPGSLLDATNALVSNEILKLTMEELMAGQDSLNGEISEGFKEGVCPLFRHYTLHLLAHQHITDNDTLTRNSLITLLLENLSILSCNYMKTSCPESEVQSRINCTLGSMAQLCFNLDTPRELFSQLMTGTTRGLLTGENVESWLKQIIPGRQPQSDVLETLTYVVLPATFLDCNIPVNATADQINCTEVF